MVAGLRPFHGAMPLWADCFYSTRTTANYFAIERKRILSDCRICIKASHDGLLHPDFSLNYSIICRGGFSVLPFVRSLSFSRSLPLSLSHDVN